MAKYIDAERYINNLRELRTGDRDDCFKLKEKYREEWLKIDG